MPVSPWTEDRLDRLKTLWLEGKTAAEVAQALGPDISRSAVLGKVYRLAMKRGRAGRAAPVRATAPPAPDRRRLAQSLGASMGSGRPQDTDAAAEQGSATILSVGRCECRWPFGDPRGSEFSLCGRLVSRGAYCALHAAMGYRPTPDTPQSLERLARMA